MPIDQRHIGKKYGPTRYEVGLEKMREFAYAVGGGVPTSSFGASAPSGLNPLLFDEQVAKDSPYGKPIAFPTFPVTFAMAPFGQAVTDPELGINLLMLVHGEQEFELFDAIHPGDVMTTTGTVTQIYEKAGKDFVVVVTESRNQKGKLVVRGTWTAVIRQG
ncbi:MAG: MaoC family dehydratase N-terminal domain-containing protein [Myxococcales bacterium]|nr:MaoC family dehydratase N-terminal domain-containing protein [Myxococcales bacterium]